MPGRCAARPGRGGLEFRPAWACRHPCPDRLTASARHIPTSCACPRRRAGNRPAATAWRLRRCRACGHRVGGFRRPVQRGEALRQGQRRGRAQHGAGDAEPAHRRRDIEVADIERARQLVRGEADIQHDRAGQAAIRGVGDQDARLEAFAELRVAGMGGGSHGDGLGHRLAVVPLHLRPEHRQRRDILRRQAADRIGVFRAACSVERRRAISPFTSSQQWSDSLSGACRWTLFARPASKEAYLMPSYEI